MLDKSLPGMKFGTLTAIRFVERISAPSGKNFKITMWAFECDCGEIVVRDVQTTKRSKWANCGCSPPLTWKKMGRTPLPFGEASFNHLFRSYQRGAKDRDLIFEISKEEFRSLIVLPCFYCGLPASRKHRAVRGVHGHFTYSGLDRRDNTKGYTVDNLVPCCKICNYAKRNVTESEFMEWLDRFTSVGV